jgi:hypothetical protein
MTAIGVLILAAKLHVHWSVWLLLPGLLFLEAGSAAVLRKLGAHLDAGPNLGEGVYVGGAAPFGSPTCTRAMARTTATSNSAGDTWT